MVTILLTRQEITLAHNDILRTAKELKNLFPKLNSAVWKGGTKLRQCVKQIAYQCILTGNIQAYTTKEDKEGEQEELPHSLFAKVMTEILSSPSEWKDRVLPPGYGKDPEPGTPTALCSLTNNTLKEVRKAFEKTLKKKEKGLIGGRFRFREEIVKDITELQKTQYAWLRMQAVH